jgi:GT2 family glycosyltransferase
MALASGAVSAERRVSLVILTHERLAEVTGTLERAVALPDRPAIIVVDNGSRDGTAAVLTRRFPRVTVVALPDNRGAAGRNEGARRADTPFVAFSDDDTWWAPGALTRAAELLEGHPSLALITGRVLVGTAEREDPTCRLMAESPLARESGMPGSPVLGFLAGASVARRDAFLAAGGYEPRFFLGGEEALVAVDLLAAGWTLAYVPEVVAHHHPSAARDATRRRSLLARNALWFAWLRRPWRPALRATAVAARRALTDPVARRGLREAASGAAWAWRHRRPLPARVEAMLERIERD